MLRVAVFHAAFLLCAWYAVRVGGTPERAAMFAQGLALALTLSTGFLHVSGAFETLLPAWLAIDLLLFVALTILALLADRIWTMVLAGLQLAAVFAHLAKGLYPDLPPFGYAVFLQLWAYPMLVVTALGVRKHHLRTRQHGPEPHWTRAEFRSEAFRSRMNVRTSMLK